MLAVTVGAAVSLTRTTGPGALNSIWIEDARDLLSQAYLQPFGHLLTVPLRPYYEDTGRVATEIAIQFPITWTPGVMSTIAALFYAISGLIAYVASGPHLRNPVLRLLIAAPCVMIPLGYTQANNDLATMQFVMMYGTFWVLLWVPSTWGGKIAAALFMLSVAANMLIDFVYAPLVVARLIADRSKTAICVTAIWLVGVCVQWSPSLSGKAQRLDEGPNSPLWIGWQYVSQVVPRALFGEKALGGPGSGTRTTGVPNYQITATTHLWLALAAWSIVLIVLLAGRVRLASPNWPLAGTALLFSVVVLEGELLISTPVLMPRYVICPALLVYTALVAATRPHGTAGLPAVAGREPPGWSLRAASWLPVAGLSAVVALAIAANFLVVNGRSTNKPWTTIVETARAECLRHGARLPSQDWNADPAQGGAYTYWYLWYRTTIPCDRVPGLDGRDRVQGSRRHPSFVLAGPPSLRRVRSAYARPVISSPQARAADDDGSVNRASRALATRAA